MDIHETIEAVFNKAISPSLLSKDDFENFDPGHKKVIRELGDLRATVNEFENFEGDERYFDYYVYLTDLDIIPTESFEDEDNPETQVVTIVASIVDQYIALLEWGNKIDNMQFHGNDASEWE